MNTVSIWKDLVLLKWDGHSPPDAPDNSIFNHADVIHFWPHVKGYMKWYKSMNCFGMRFSKQNMKRLHAQFGALAIKSGKERITALKSDDSDIFEMFQTIKKVKELPAERLPNYEYKMKPLGEYQHRGVVFLRNVKRAPLFADCGMGKTYMVINSTEMQIKYGEIPKGKTLICAKLATLETGWLEDIEKFSGLKAKVLWLPSSDKKRKQKIIAMMDEPADVYIINHDGLRVYKDDLIKKSFKKIVVDESTILKSFRSMDPRARGGVFAKALMEVAHSADYRVIMSGTPASNGPEDLWGQYAFLDPKGIMLEPSFNDFRESYYDVIDLRPRHLRYVINKETNKFVEGPDGKFIKKPMNARTPKKYVPKKGAITELNSIIANSAYRLKLRDHIKDLPDLSIIPIKMDMDLTQLGHYKDMNKKLKVEINEERITVPMQLNKMMKLRQITGGFIIDNNQKAHSMKNNPKMDMMDSILNDEIDRENKVVIFAEYRWEIESIFSRYKKHGIVSVYGGNTSSKNLKAIKQFREDPEIRLIVLHPKSAAHGITLTMAHYLIFYSFSHSAEDNYQAIKRIERAGQKNAMFVYYLMMSKTIDTAMKEVLKLKNENQSRLIDQEELDIINQKDLDNQLLEMWRKNG